MKKISLIFLVLLIFLGLVSCKKDEPMIDNPGDISYKITIYDLDGELLADDVIAAKSDESLFARIKTDYLARYEESDYGPYLTSVAGSIIDPNYYVAIYENDEYATKGIAELEVNDNDHFTFRVECFNQEFDKYDLLLDKAIYGYMKDYFKDVISKEKSFSPTSNEHWSYMFIDLMRKNGYDPTIFNLDAVKEEMLDSIEDFTITSLTGAAIGKYYYIARALDYDLTAFLAFYQEFADNNTYGFSEYTSPFIMRPAKDLATEPTWLASYVNAKLASTTFGPDGAGWQIMAQSIFRDITAEELAPLKGKFSWEYSNNATSKSILLATFASAGIDMRSSEYEVENQDILEHILGTYYIDGLVCYDENTLEPNYSTSQIYAYLAAYKVFRDTGNKVSIFA